VKAVLRGIKGCLGCFCVSETAQVELKSERVLAPAAISSSVGSTSTMAPRLVSRSQVQGRKLTLKANFKTNYALLVWGVNGDGAWRGLVTIVESIDPRPYIFQVTVYGNLIYTVIYMSDRLLTQANPNPRLPPTPDLRRSRADIETQL